MTDTAITGARSAYYPYGFPLSRAAWTRYGVASLDAPEGYAGRVWSARALAERLNAGRDFSRPKAQPARAGELLSMGLLTDALRYMVVHYCRDLHPGALARGLAWVRENAGPVVVDRTLPAFVSEFPPQTVQRGELTEQAYLEIPGGALSNREVAAREALLERLTVENRAVASYGDLFDDTVLRQRAPYEVLVEKLDAFFSEQPPYPGARESLIAMLRAPMLACPDSLEGQLEFVRARWNAFLPKELLEELLLVEGVLKEETAMRGMGPGPMKPLTFGGLVELGYAEPEAFSHDKDWMPNLVLLAKTVYVWLDQLSKKYAQEIRRLDDIPDAELDRLASWGFTGLWLIGLWERSPASQTIKQRMGNPEAAPSAYSLYDYVIAADLGGEAAYEQLAARAWQRGIRLASDMVPNHVGLYSKWVIEHPDWFVQLDRPPFPSYRFTGPDLSWDPRVGLYIEDGYWNHSDAAVVFMRVDRATGETRFIYHGNDGTSMPWNDTAQLNFMRADVREAVAQTILHVARKFPIIRFDAAMTLAKRHYQRLWFPKLGDAGAIPSRAEHGMSKADFDAQFPVEFWREVVDRVAAEAPDTLLLAEAFWLMEGYFVRTLGMHRVYNSAFMNMLKMEENSKYRQTLKNVLEFSPEVLQRFVNFMNNPDEDTAEAQFGKGDKYFGVAALMATMPGLPMFGHGQVEGFTEKYGMEYRRAYWDETVDDGLVARHEAEIFPLLRQRYLFSGAWQFALFDFVVPEGWVDENVFAYTNRNRGERGLVVYNNAYRGTRGVLHTSTAINVGTVEAPRLERRNLVEALGLNTEETCYYIFRDHRGGLEYLRHTRQFAEQGLPLELGGYQYYAFLDWREVHDFDNSWGKLHAALGDRGVPNVEDAYNEMHLASVIEPFRHVINAAMLERLAKPARGKAALEPFRKAMTALLDAIGVRLGRNVDAQPILDAVERDLKTVRGFAEQFKKAGWYPETDAYLSAGLPEKDGFPLEFWRMPITWAVVRHIGRAASLPEPRNGFDPFATSAAWMREWFLIKQIARAFADLDGDAWRADLDARLVRIAIAHAERLLTLQSEPWAPVLDTLLRDADVRAYLGVNHFGGRRWLNKEQLEHMLYGMFLTLALPRLAEGEAAADALMLCLDDIGVLLEAAEDANYDLDRMFESLK